MRLPADCLSRYAALAPERARANIETFLNRMGCDAADIEERLGSQFGVIHDILFVSTVASGLAGSTSDLDVILIVNTIAADQDRISTTMFTHGKRMGVKAYTHPEALQSIDLLAEIGGRPLSLLPFSRNQWDSIAPVPWVELERLINGFSFKSGMPYVFGLPRLSVAWFVGAFEQFRRAVILATLAERAGERRGRYGYAVMALRSLMDAVMASHGRVHWNAKWVPERWRRFCSDSDGAVEVPLVGRITAVWEQTLSAIEGGCVSPIGDALRGLYRDAKAAHMLVLSEDDQPLRFVEGLRLHPLLDGVSLATSSGPGFVIVESSSLEELADWTLTVSGRFSPLQTAALLALARGGLVGFPIDRTCCGPTLMQQ